MMCWAKKRHNLPFRECMIRFDIDNSGQLRLFQQDISPTVYLDHWALRKISANKTLAARFVDSMQQRKGTLAISWLNLAEFIKVKDKEQARKAELLIEAILPHIFFMDVQFLRVIGREDAAYSSGLSDTCHSDANLCRAFAQLKSASLKQFTARDMFSVMRNDRLVSSFDSMADALINEIEVVRDERNKTPEIKISMDRLPPGSQIQRGTRYILRELVRTLLVDCKIKVTRNHAIDLMHAVVPCAYCDLLLLDKFWEAQFIKVYARSQKAGMTFPLGRVFSERDNGVDRFLTVLADR
jgi:hypothetical protein